jgi:SAM-dependent methyltransferase
VRRQRAGDPSNFSVGVTLVADDAAAKLVCDRLNAFAATTRVRPGPGAAFTRQFRHARIGLVAATVAIPGAVVAGRLFRLPWGLVLDRPGADRLAGRPNGLLARLAREAPLVVAASDAVDAVRAFAPTARVVELGDADRLRSVLEDVALPVEETVRGGGLIGPAVAGGWMFLDDRANRLAIRLMPVTGRSSIPTHPKHLLDVPWHHWYLADVGPEDTVLDVGCNNGAHAFVLATRAARVVGVDVDQDVLALARARAAAEGAQNVDFVAGDLTAKETLAGLEARSFDVALALDVLEHLVDRESVLGSVRSLLRPGGRLIVAVPNVDTSYKRWRRRLGGRVYSDPDHKIEFTAASIRRELEQAGFRVERIELGGYDTPFGGLTSLVGVVSLDAYARVARRRHELLLCRPQEATAFRVVAVNDPQPVDASTRA